MKKGKMFIAILIIWSILLICCVFLVYLNSNFHHSKLLTNAILSQKDDEVIDILQRNPDCVNAYPSVVPYWYRCFFDMNIVHYPLVEACLTGNIELVEILIEYGADVNLGVGAGFSPLALTYTQKPENWYQISVCLIENGASLDYDNQNSNENILTDIIEGRPGAMVDDYGPEKSNDVETAFYYAIENCDHSQINWMRVLQYSVSNDRIEIVKFLVNENYCDVNDNSVGMTALMFAARDSTPEMVQLLLDYGANKEYKSSNGKTAYDYAVETGNQEIIDLLS
jgi:ankyrin repeat protein